MGNSGKGRNKEKQNIQGPLGMKIDTTTVPQQQRQKACWAF
jgi:hypothetical protein